MELEEQDSKKDSVDMEVASIIFMFKITFFVGYRIYKNEKKLILYFLFLHFSSLYFRLILLLTRNTGIPKFDSSMYNVSYFLFLLLWFHLFSVVLTDLRMVCFVIVPPISCTDVH